MDLNCELINLCGGVKCCIDLVCGDPRKSLDWFCGLELPCVAQIIASLGMCAMGIIS